MLLVIPKGYRVTRTSFFILRPEELFLASGEGLAAAVFRENTMFRPAAPNLMCVETERPALGALFMAFDYRAKKEAWAGQAPAQGQICGGRTPPFTEGNKLNETAASVTQ